MKAVDLTRDRSGVDSTKKDRRAELTHTSTAGSINRGNGLVPE